MRGGISLTADGEPCEGPPPPRTADEPELQLRPRLPVGLGRRRGHGSRRDVPGRIEARPQDPTSNTRPRGNGLLDGREADKSARKLEMVLALD